MFIENCSMKDIASGNHYDAGKRGVLIQITDPAFEPPKPRVEFERVHHFEFLDAEIDDDYPAEFKITKPQAEAIANILLLAKLERRNVIVHCHAGTCRSGAIAEIGVMLGFDDAEKYRQPNLMVKSYVLDALHSLGAFEVS